MPEAIAVKRFRFDPTINLGHILTAVVMGVSVLTSWITLNTRVDFQEREIERVERQLRDQLQMDRLRTREDVIEIKALLRGIDVKLDQKQDKRP